MQPASVESGEAMFSEDRQTNMHYPEKQDEMQTKIEEARRDRSGVEKDRLRRETGDGVGKDDYAHMGFSGPSEVAKKADTWSESYMKPKMKAVTVWPPVCEGKV